MISDNNAMTAYKITEAIRSKRLSARQAVTRCIESIEKHDGDLRAFIRCDARRSLELAASVDERIAHDQPVGPLAGLPIALKDNMCTKFGETTCASAILKGFKAPYDAHVIEKLASADAIIIGKTNLDEFAMGSSTENSGTFVSRNPWDRSRVPGGSSGGSAVAVATRMAPAALGSDTGGSVRQPAGMCGVVGLKPTYGRVSRYGLVAFASSLDQIGPITLDVKDAALLLSVIAGHDRRDSTSVDEPVPDYVGALGSEVERMAGVRIGVPTDYFGEGLDDEVRSAVEAALRLYAREGAELIELPMPHTRYAVACYYVIATAEASSNLARYDGVHYGHRTEAPADFIDLCCQSRQEGFGPEVKRRIMLGTFALSSGYYDAYYVKALKVRTLITRDFREAFEKVDVIASPVSPTTAFALGEKISDPLAMYLADIYTLSASLAGVPAVSIPCGFDDENLPIGLQLMGPWFAEERLLAIAHQYQLRTDYHTRSPVDRPD